MFEERLGQTPYRKTGALLFLACVATSCQETPAEFVRGFEQALRTGDVSSMESMVTPESRPMLRILPKALLGRLSPKAPPAQVVRLQQHPRGVLAHIQSGDDRAVWVLRAVQGRWQLDLWATADQGGLDAL